MIYVYVVSWQNLFDHSASLTAHTLSTKDFDRFFIYFDNLLEQNFFHSLLTLQAHLLTCKIQSNKNEKRRKIFLTSNNGDTKSLEVISEIGMIQVLNFIT